MGAKRCSAQPPSERNSAAVDMALRVHPSASYWKKTLSKLDLGIEMRSNNSRPQLLCGWESWDQPPLKKSLIGKHNVHKKVITSTPNKFRQKTCQTRRQAKKQTLCLSLLCDSPSSAPTTAVESYWPVLPLLLVSLTRCAPCQFMGALVSKGLIGMTIVGAVGTALTTAPGLLETEVGEGLPALMPQPVLSSCASLFKPVLPTSDL